MDRIEKHTELIQKLQQISEKQLELSTQTQEHLIGLNTAFNVVTEILISQSQDQKNALSDGLRQLLDRDDGLENKKAREILDNLQKIAASPSRLTPEGRRSWLHVVPDPEPNPEPGSSDSDDDQ